MKNLFVVPVENISICTQDDRASKRFWGQYVFETNTICDVWLQVLDSMGVGRISSREGPLLDCYKIFSRGGAKVVKFVFFLQETKKTTILMKFSKSRWGRSPPMPYFLTPMSDSYPNVAKLSKSRFSSTAHIHVNLDSLPFCT